MPRQFSTRKIPDLTQADDHTSVGQGEGNEISEGNQMSDEAMVRSLMAPLIKKAGGYLKAATLIDAQLDIERDKDGMSTRQGTIHRRQKARDGVFLIWPRDEIWALEDALGDYRVSHFRYQQTATQSIETGCILDVLSEACAESGGAFGAVTAFLAGKGSREDALREVEESIAAKKRLRTVLGREDG